MVKVRLVEKRVKRKAGSVIDEKVISQTKAPGTALTIWRRPFPNHPSHVELPAISEVDDRTENEGSGVARTGDSNKEVNVADV